MIDVTTLSSLFSRYNLNTQPAAGGKWGHFCLPHKLIFDSLQQTQIDFSASFFLQGCSGYFLMKIYFKKQEGIMSVYFLKLKWIYECIV